MALVDQTLTRGGGGFLSIYRPLRGKETEKRKKVRKQKQRPEKINKVLVLRGEKKQIIKNRKSKASA
jgi:hypothetical protein